MLALTLGLAAALAWAVHDLLVRKLSQGAALLPMMLAVLASGCVILIPLTVMLADPGGISRAGLAVSGLAGLAYALGMGGLYKALSLAPVRLVAPILGAYPMLSLGFAAVQGRAIAPLEWAAVAAIVLGIAIVALTGREGGAGPARALPAIGWAVLGACGFASTFALGQEAARLAGDLPAILISRMVALGLVAGLALALRAPLLPPRPQRATLAAMGLLDAAALGLVLASGGLPHPEYAAVASALFGVLTILLAWRLLAEAVRPAQWAGIATVFAGIAVLSLQG